MNEAGTPPRRERAVWFWAIAAAVCAGLIAGFAVNGPGPLLRTEAGQWLLQKMVNRKPAPPGLAMAERGQPLPPIQVSTLGGQRIPLPLPAGRPVLINVWASWCGPCLKEMPDLAAFARSQGPDGVQVLGLALDDAEAVHDWLAHQPSPYPHVRDAPGPRDAGVQLGNRSGVLPYSVLVNADGRLSRSRIGPFTSATDIEQWITPGTK